MILEKANIQYKNNGEYDYTINSKFLEFENLAMIYDYIFGNLEKDVEYFIYENKEKQKENECYKSIVCNDYIRYLENLKSALEEYVENYNENNFKFKITSYEIIKDFYTIYYENTENGVEYFSTNFFNSNELENCKTINDFLYVIDRTFTNDIENLENI